MIFELTSALLKDITSFLSQEPHFLTLSSEERRKKTPELSPFFADMTEEIFFADLQLTLKALKHSAPFSESKIVRSIARYFIQDFPGVFDQLDDVFYSSSPEEQKTRLKTLFPEKELFFDVLRGRLVLSSPQEITESIVQFLTNIFESPRVVVQSPVGCTFETKKEIRAHFLEETPETFVDFSINPQLIGGIRFFVDGKVRDHSWFARIADIRRLHHLVA